MKQMRLMAVFLLILTVCGAGTAETALEDHTEHVWEEVGTVEPTCGESGYTYYRCACGAEKAVRGEPADGHHVMQDGVCSLCGYIDMSNLTEAEAMAAYGFYHQDADNSGTYTTGDIVSFGRYPQSLAGADHVDYDALQAVTEGDWISYGYYSDGVQQDYMQYKDVTVNGKQYRGVQMSAYRPYYTGLPAGEESSYIDDSGYGLNSVYWFAWEPLTWNVLEYRNGELLLNARYCLDAQPFQDLYEGNRSRMVIPGTETLTNDWEACSLRRFLNGEFLSQAFSEEEQERIETSALNNKTTGYEVNAKFQIIQNDTEDQIFLLSYEDVLNTDYGYPAQPSFDLEANGDNINEIEAALNRRRSYTDYAAVQGCRPSTQGVTANNEPACYYMLRSAGTVKFSISGVSKYGSASSSGSINPTSKASQDGLSFNGDFGVLPALRIKAGIVK